VVQTLTDANTNSSLFDGPWASAVNDKGSTAQLFVSQDPAHLRGPIGLALAPNGDLLTTNDDAVNVDPSQPSELIEFTPTGQFVGELSLDPALGAAFQIVVQSTRHTVTIASLNDDLGTVDFRTITI
jgi:hypothetical protein